MNLERMFLLEVVFEPATAKVGARGETDVRRDIHFSLTFHGAL
jgi:hypothetical protein